MNYEKHIHYDLEIERAVLGQLIIESQSISRVVGTLKAEYFHLPEHRKVFAAMEEMFRNSVPIDSLTLCHHLATESNLKNLNGEVLDLFILRLTNSVCSSAHLEFHAHILHQQWQRRAILSLKAGISLENSINPLDEIKSLQNQLKIVIEGNVEKDWKSMDELMYDLIKHQIKMTAGEFKYITSGFTQIDKANGGFSAGELIILAARPRVGKSSLLGKMSISQARKGFKVGILSLEMPNTQISARLASLETGIPYMKVYKDLAKDEAEHRRFYEIISNSTVNLPLYVSDKTKVSLPEIRAKAMKLKNEVGLDILYIDYLQLIDGKTQNKNYNREQEVSQLSRGLKTLARELEIPIVALAQLNRDVEKRTGDKRYPVLSDLRESGSIEQDADIIMFAHRDFISGVEIDKDGYSTENNADLIIGKWRNGMEFKVELGFEGNQMKFYEKEEQAKGSFKKIQHIEVDYTADNPF